MVGDGRELRSLSLADIPPIAPEGKWPGMCGIYYKRENTYSYLAGASLVTPGIVMTAAHWVV